ncbi:hypothetical protein [Fluoribacter gormanii]|uniref:Uncharacterized protein n=1 Tax=Fluoribacter gormanii TaxID=464 RepID=A0A377GP43_9GAMM|nr:hypothetical protein [Fluoribacter gormanii]KTD00528.1 hypothetical protein Lgor_3004 [Fluoribacter gormanii]MCW8445259.1 hypothetical protein [Fluoribacter gormanii]SIR07430.1 hypothetical protein SAMN05421777_10653 [Fluoribacter gormanii]STO26394.1 Uncharacterised protein [Fluoribacter gormanii]
MRWMDKFWTATHWVFDTTVHTVADTMNVCATLACSLGGAAFAVSNALSLHDVTASYYGSVHAEGNFTLGVDLASLENYRFNESYPLSYNNHVNNGTTYNLTDYVNAGTLQTASAICVASGVALKTLGASINHWQQNREERRYYARTKEMQIAKPSYKEYAYVGAEAFTGAVSNAMLSNAVTAAVLHISEKSFPSITYPPHSKQLVSGAHYNGPVISEPFKIGIDLGDSNFTIPLYFDNLNVLLKKTIDVAANATYGGGFFFKRNDVEQEPPLAATEAVSSTVAVSAYLASNFFARKAKELHSERVQGEARPYTLI